MDNQALLETNKQQTVQYFYVLNMFLLCYGFALSPNLYSIFACAFALIFIGTRSTLIFIIIEIAAGCVPVTYHFLQDDYILLNMLTYFPYPERDRYYQMLANVVMVWAIFMILFAIQFMLSKKLNFQQNLNQIIQQIRRDEMR
ncbi:Transmembrane_domain-containing protein [Hexamita inflata]|uniref:Transmembrane domain-containing protein n=1 Tax=Hexamita inflata TaxID=28002 RepID=A0AA86Q9K6_9EUKA|nr:Transmembrane domain-containing protein [Hexamita inflata]CAI9920756.1 Transmembrane domain-containing protein [Hexamita inflata]CAI9951318.1 Transmembrane domain-containing protein [Hexamita inflata]